MPTLLGLLRNDEPYFAFGRDLLNEPERPGWSVSYSGGNFRALTDDTIISFDEKQAETKPRTDSGADIAKETFQHADSLLPSLKALIQQYYTHIERKRYTIDD